MTRKRMSASARGRDTSVRHARAGAASLYWLLLLVAVALAAIIVLAARHREMARQQAVSAGQQPQPVPATVMADFKNIPAATWERAGSSGATVPTFVPDSDFANHKPVVLYIGAGYCPYCAAARWSMIAALSRFGTFSDLTYAFSSGMDVFPNTPTFSFFGSHFTSPYVDFQSVELQGDLLLANGQYQPLETPTSAQQALLDKYDAPPYTDARGAGGIPFILVGGRYMWGGSPFSPDLLAGTQADIAATLPTGSGEAARAILANGNELTAAICALDGGQPSAVCSGPAVQKAMKKLSHKGG